MRILQSSLCRAFVAMAVGVLLIKYPADTVTGITVAIGVMFLLSGLVSLLTYWNAHRHASEYKIYDADGNLLSGGEPTFPIVGIGSMLLGCILALMPATFVSLLTYVIGIVLVLGAVTQMMALIGARHFADLSLWFWLGPVVTMLMGAYFMLRPLEPAEMAMAALGWLSLFYGVIEIVNSWKIFSCRKAAEHRQQQAAMSQEEATQQMTADLQ